MEWESPLAERVLGRSFQIYLIPGSGNQVKWGPESKREQEKLEGDFLRGTAAAASTLSVVLTLTVSVSTQFQLLLGLGFGNSRFAGRGTGSSCPFWSRQLATVIHDGRHVVTPFSVTWVSG